MLLKYSRRMANRCLYVAFVISVIFVGSVYFLLFHKPPTDDIINANRQRKGHRSIREPNLLDKDVKDMTAAEYAKAKWDAWVTVHDLASIGEIYDKCEGEDRINIGRVVMVKDPKTGGLIYRTFCNMTIATEVTTGDMGLQVWYNTRDLYKNHWELCTVEDDMPETEKLIYCPVKKGIHIYKKDVLIPRYLPKGRYQTKSWAYDQNDKMVACAFSDFTL